MSVFKVNSQNYFNAYKKIIKEETKEKSIKIVDSLLLLCKKNNESYNYSKIAFDFSAKIYKKKLPLALNYVSKSLTEFESTNFYPTEYYRGLYRAGKFNYINLEYDKAINYYTKLIKISKNNFRTASACTELGKCYKKKNNLFKAILFFKKGINLLQKEKKYKALVGGYNDISNVYKKLGDIKNQQIFLKKADSLSKIINIKKRTYIIINNSLGNLYSTKEVYDFKKSRNYYFKSLKLAKENNQQKLIALRYNNLSNLYNLEKNDSAKYFINLGLNLNPEKLTKARFYDNYSNYYLIRNNLEKAYIHINNALNTNLEFDIEKTKNLPNFKNTQNKDYTLYCLNRKTEILIKLYLKEKKTIYLTKAHETIKYADHLVDIIQEDISENNTKLFWRKEASKTYLKGAYISFLLRNKEAFFYYTEKNKAILLTESIQKNTEHSNLPKNISTKEKELKQIVLQLESKAIKNTALQDSLFTAKIVYDNYYDSIKSKYPKFFKTVFKTEVMNLSSVQKSLTKNTIALSYIWNKNNEEELLFGMFITKNTSNLFQIKNIEELKKNIQNYTKSISTPLETNKAKKEFQQTAFELYNQLFPLEKVRNTLNNKKKLIIIPDGDLQNLPFESLITTKNTNDYLLYKTDINYAYSFSFSKYNDAIKRKTSLNFIGYSPNKFFDNNLLELKNSQKEIKAIQNIVSGNIYNEIATKNHFLEKSKSAKIIHLATHANATKNPWIAFSDDKLNLHELYTYKNNADLVVLSACNTSIGKVEQGEGVFSLARGFFYAGAKSVVSSLWSVNDKSTSCLMTQFYKNIKSGQNKSEALTNAKKEYLKSHSLTSASPYYWASFVLIGNSDTIQLSNHNYFYFILLLLFIILIIFLIKTQKK